MPLIDHQYIWTHPGHMEQAWAFIMSAMSIALGRPESRSEVESYAEFTDPSASKRAEIKIALESELAYFVETDVRTSSTRNKRKLALAGNIPATPSNTRSVRLHKDSKDQQSRIQTLVVSEATLAELQRVASERGCLLLQLSSVNQPDEWFPTPQTRAVVQRRSMWSLAAWAALIFAVAFCGDRWLQQQQLSLQVLQDTASALRTAALTRQIEQDQVNALDRFASFGPDQKTPSARAQLLAQLASSTPQHAYWTNITIEDNTIELSGISTDAMSVLRQLQSDFPNHVVAMPGPLRMIGDDQQAFLIRLKSEKAEG